MKKIILSALIIFVLNLLCAQENENYECIRGQAEPIVLKTVFPKTEFHLNEDSISGIETIIINESEKVTINNVGCEYYTLNFVFETKIYNEELSNLNYWYKATYNLLNEIKIGLASPIDIELGLEYFKKYLKNNKNKLELNTEIDFGQTDANAIRNVVTLHEITKIGDKYFINISFSIGPL